MVFGEVTVRALQFALIAYLCAPAVALADPFKRLTAQVWVVEAHNAVTCNGGQRYSVSADRNEIFVEFGESVKVRGEVRDNAQYDVLGYGANHIDMFLRQETWRDAEGNLVWWRLKFLNDGRFVWIRSDWATGKSTKPRMPCEVLG